MVDELDMRHFETLRQRINSQLTRLGLSEQTKYQWLYGALSAVPSDVVFICENPSRDGVEKADWAARCGGRQPDIEDQWRGSGPGDPATRIFRPVLCEFGLKLTPPGDRGGWQCYVTNVIKEMAVAKNWGELSLARVKYPKAIEWADILEWELQQIQPSWAFCVGDNAYDLVGRLQRSSRLPSLQGQHLHHITHYSARKSDVRGLMLKDIRSSGFCVERE